MEESILLTVKKLSGVGEQETFDGIRNKPYINSVFGILWQLGVGPSEGYEIEDEGNIWKEFLPDRKYLNAVKTYIALKVKKVFDPPQNTSVLEALNNSINEYEWRINVMVDPGDVHVM